MDNNIKVGDKIRVIKHPVKDNIGKIGVVLSIDHALFPIKAALDNHRQAWTWLYYEEVEVIIDTNSPEYVQKQLDEAKAQVIELQKKLMEVTPREKLECFMLYSLNDKRVLSKHDTLIAASNQWRNFTRSDTAVIIVRMTEVGVVLPLPAVQPAPIGF